MTERKIDIEREVKLQKGGRDNSRRREGGMFNLFAKKVDDIETLRKVAANANPLI